MFRPARVLFDRRVGGLSLRVHWQWLPGVALGTVLLARGILPVWMPDLDPLLRWLAGLLVVLAMEASLLAHELAHAAAARLAGQVVEGISVFGLAARTTVRDHHALPPADDARTAAVGPLASLLLAAGFGAAYAALHTAGPMSFLTLVLAFGNLASAATSLLPLPGSDGARVLRGIRTARVPVALAE